jgi:hypothetical protein
LPQKKWRQTTIPIASRIRQSKDHSAGKSILFPSQEIPNSRFHGDNQTGGKVIFAGSLILK